MNEQEAKVLLADLVRGLGRIESRHDQHRFLESLPVDESEMQVAWLKAEASEGDYAYTR